MHKKPGAVLYVFCVLVLVVSCKTSQRLIEIRDMAKNYNPGMTYLHPKRYVWHTDTSYSMLMIKVFPDELLYSQANKELRNIARLRVFYKLSEIVNNETVEIDTGTYVYPFEKGKTQQQFLAQIPVHAKQGREYSLKVVLTDLNRQFSITDYIRVDKRNTYSYQNFGVLASPGNYPLTPPYNVAGLPVHIKCFNNTPDSLFVNYFAEVQHVPGITSAFQSSYKRPDSVWRIAYNPDAAYRFDTPGVFFLQYDTAVQGGLCLLHFGADFPQIKRATEMLPPIQYLANNFEYQNLQGQTNTKLAIDNFWLSKTESIERARELIRIYYNRVYLSNYYFTSDRQGWQTDRGMVYIIYGPPEAVYKKHDREEWLYFPEDSSDPVSLVFKYNASEFYEDDYRLSRSESNTSVLNDALQAWRTGKIFYTEE